MNPIKTGRLIAAKRKEQNKTQQAIADELHVTSKAVSKWERGLSFPGVDLLEPLAKVLGISIPDLFAGEVITAQNAADKIEEVSLDTLHVLKKKQLSQRRFWIASAAAALLLMALLLQAWGPAIFQRGNPIPYLAAAMHISEETPFAEVEKNSGIYISERGSCPALLAFVADHWNVTFTEQAGSGYLFSNGVDGFAVSSEIFWGRWTVWQVPQHTLQAP